VTGVHHLALRAESVLALAAFYVAVFRLDELDRQTDELGVKSIWLGLGEAILMIERRGPGEPAPDPTSREVQIFSGTKQDRLDVEQRLADAGFSPAFRSPYTTYLRDPEGRLTGISHYPER